MSEPQSDPVLREFLYDRAVFSAFSVEQDDIVISLEAQDARDVSGLLPCEPQLRVINQGICTEKTGLGGGRELHLFDTIVFCKAAKVRKESEWTQETLFTRSARGKA